MVRECALNGITLKYQGTRVSFDIETHYFESDSDFIPNVTSKNQIFRLIQGYQDFSFETTFNVTFEN